MAGVGAGGVGPLVRDARTLTAPQYASRSENPNICRQLSLHPGCNAQTFIHIKSREAAPPRVRARTRTHI